MFVGELSPCTHNGASPILLYLILPVSSSRLDDLRACLAAGEPAEKIADSLCRNVDEVRAKTAEIAGRQ